jgi:hypothetical protein
MQHFDHQDKVNCRDFSVCEMLMVFGPRGVAVGLVLDQSAIFTQLYLFISWTHKSKTTSTYTVIVFENYLIAKIETIILHCS